VSGLQKIGVRLIYILVAYPSAVLLLPYNCFVCFIAENKVVVVVTCLAWQRSYARTNSPIVSLFSPFLVKF